MTEVEKLSQNQKERERTGTQSPEDSSVDVRKAVRQHLESLRLAGLTHVPTGTGNYSFDWSVVAPKSDVTDQATPSKPQATKVAPALRQPDSVRESASVTSEYTKDSGGPLASTPSSSAQSSFISSDPWGPSLPLSDRKSGLQILQNEIAGCTKCDELSSHRTQTVFGVGNPAARLVFVGEAPGAQEDRQGEPFVGEAGQLLDKIMGACKLTRADVFILNTVKCRPPGNRNPGQEELANCWGYAEQQLAILQPEFICCLGSVAARTLLKTTQSLGRLRKRFHAYRGSRVLVTYHPAYLLRTPSAKRHVWDDMKMLMKEMGVDVSK
jgi:uracil-DNA glycosylase family 4